MHKKIILKKGLRSSNLFEIYSFLYENDHFNQAQAEFKKVLNGQSKQAQAEFKKEVNGKSKHAAQKRRGKKEEEKGSGTGSCVVHRLPF